MNKLFYVIQRTLYLTIFFTKKDKKWDIVIVDINSSDAASDFWAPTKQFVEFEFLKNCNAVLSKPKGINTNIKMSRVWFRFKKSIFI